MNALTRPLISVFDRLQAFAEAEPTRRCVGKALIFYFLAALALIELNSLGWLPGFLAENISTNRFAAVTQTFTLVLVLEVVDLVFSLPKSTSRSVGKQFEILALILLRNAFKELTNLPFPIDIVGHTDVLIRLATDEPARWGCSFCWGHTSMPSAARPSTGLRTSWKNSSPPRNLWRSSSWVPSCAWACTTPR